MAQKIPNDLILKQMQKVVGDQRIVVPTPSKVKRGEYEALDRQFENLEKLGKYEDAIRVADRKLNVAKRLWGPEGGETSFAMIDLGRLYLFAEEYAKAEPLLVEAARIQLKEFGPNNPQTAIGLGSLADLYLDLAEYYKAEPLYKQALQNFRFIYGSKVNLPRFGGHENSK